MAYAYDIRELWRQLGYYTDLILKGTKPDAVSPIGRYCGKSQKSNSR